MAFFCRRRFLSGESLRKERDGDERVMKFAVINANKDFRTLYYRGKSQVHPALVTYVRKNRAGLPRAGITASKKLGGAVQRNRCRRVIREAYRQLLPEIRGGWDLVFVARTRTLYMKSTEVRRVMEAQLQKAGVLPKPVPPRGEPPR